MGIQGSSRFISGRDEFGLPLFVDKMKEKGDLTVNKKVDGMQVPIKLYEESIDTSKTVSLEGVSGAKNSQGIEKEFAVRAVAESPKNPEPSLAKNTWSNVVKTPPRPVEKVKFDYCPPAEGSRVVSPPIEVLQKGNNKCKHCVIGTFTKGRCSFSSVVSYVRTMWKSLNVLNIAQREPNVFVFKFDYEDVVNFVLSRGTWYFGNKPLLVKAWGVDGKIKKNPLWVKFSRVPDCYWTQKGLSHLASVIGEPTGADEMTSRLEILPFAKLCVKYKVGNELPDKIEVETLIPGTEIKKLQEVIVQYPFKPLVCSACKSLGHLVGACPFATSSWVMKDNRNVKEKPKNSSVAGVDAGSVDIANYMEGNPNLSIGDVNEDISAGLQQQHSDPVLVVHSPVISSNHKSAMDDEGWTTVPSKRTASSSPTVEASPSPPCNFKSLKQVDEIDKKLALSKVQNLSKLSKSARKKLKKSLGAGASPTSS